MANQAIALQARAPSASSGGNAFAQNMQMMNMMAQRTAAERQAATAQQALEVSQASEARNVAGEARQVTKAELDAAEQRLKYYRNRASEVRSPEGYQNWLSEVDKEDPGMAKSFRINLPPEQFSPQTLDFMVGDYSDRFAARFGKATTSTVVTPEGGVLGVTSSSIPGASFSTPVPDISRPLAPTAPAAGVQPMAPRQTPTAQPTPQTPTGGMFQRMSATGGQPQGAAPQGADPLAPLLASLNKAKETGGQIGADVVEQLRQLDPRVTPDVIDAFLAQNGIKVAPGGGMRSAVYRGESPMAAQQVQYNPNAYAPTRAKSPMVSPTPGIYNVPAPQIAGAAAAEAGGKASVNVVAEPKIVAGTERVKRLEKLRGDQPLALSDAQTVVADMDQKIKAIDEFLVNPNRNSIIGSVEGRIPNALQGERRATVQALYDSIVSNQVLNELIKGRQATETGASPMGIVSDRDLLIAAAASNRLAQTGDERAQDREMQRLRDVLYETRQRAMQTYNNTFREVVKDAPELKLTAKPIPEKYTKPAPKTARKTPVSTLTKPLRFNPATGDFE